MANSVNPDQTAPIEAVCSGSTLFDCILEFGSNYLQQMTFADNIFRCIFLSFKQGWAENSTPVFTGGIYRYFPAWQIRLQWQILANITFLRRNTGKYDF